MAAPGDETAPQICVPWEKLLTWVQQQMASEMETGQPVVLPRTQLEALSHLVSFTEEPDVSDRDYVSLLLQEIQTRRLPAPVFATAEPVSMPVEGHFEPRWRCTCTVQSVGEFPRPGHGLSASQAAPLFQSKKNAKQFAAKHAIEYLSRPATKTNPPLPCSVLEKRPLPATPFQKSGRPRWESDPVALTATAPAQKAFSLVPPSTLSAPLPSLLPQPAAAETPPVPGVITPPPSSSSTSVTAGSGVAKKPSIFEQVTVVTDRLKIGNPSYRVEPDPAGGGLFCGRPVFKNGGIVPSEVGVVSGVEGQALAKVRIAEEVLAWAGGELRRRQDIFESLWGKATSGVAGK